MKYIFFRIAFLVCIFSTAVIALPEKSKLNILMIHSYSNDFSWTRDQDRGVISVIESNFKDLYDINYERIYLDSKTTPIKKIEQQVKVVKRELADKKFDYCVITDDLAMKLFYSFIIGKSIPLVFAGINGNIEDYGYILGTKNVSGTLERYNVLPMVSIMKKIRPPLDSILLLSEPDYTGKIILKEVFEKLTNSREIENAGLKVTYST